MTKDTRISPTAKMDRKGIAGRRGREGGREREEPEEGEEGERDREEKERRAESALCVNSSKVRNPIKNAATNTIR